MSYKISDENLRNWGEDIKKALLGFTKSDMEPLFEEYILPIYIFQARRIGDEPNYKIINRETGEEVTFGTVKEKFYKIANYKENDSKRE